MNVEECLGIILESIAAAAGQVLFLLICALGLGEFSTLVNVDPTDAKRRLLAFWGWFIIGAIIGYCTFLLLPRGIFPSNSMPGLSLILVPLLTGLATMQWGRIRQQQSKIRLTLASFWGGWSFAFGATLVRFVFIQIRAA
jgi:hypothetical protein